jgi:hypothetical protein
MKKTITSHFRRVLLGSEYGSFTLSLFKRVADKLGTEGYEVVSKPFFDELLRARLAGARESDPELRIRLETTLAENVAQRAEIARLENLIRANGGVVAPPLPVTALLNASNEWIGACPACAAPLRMEVSKPDE